jgi:hypothetical protein
MVVVAVLAIGFSLVANSRRIIRDQPDGDLNWVIIFAHVVFYALLLGFGLVVRSLIRFVERDEAYARQLRRDDPMDFDSISS